MALGQQRKCRQSQDNGAAMTAATPATIDINYILAERSREYFGEGYRWFDLVRTQNGQKSLPLTKFVASIPEIIRQQRLRARFHHISICVPYLQVSLMAWK